MKKKRVVFFWGGGNKFTSIRFADLWDEWYKLRRVVTERIKLVGQGATLRRRVKQSWMTSHVLLHQIQTFSVYSHRCFSSQVLKEFTKSCVRVWTCTCLAHQSSVAWHQHWQSLGGKCRHGGGVDVGHWANCNFVTTMLPRILLCAVFDFITLDSLKIWISLCFSRVNKDCKHQTHNLESSL